MRLNHIIAFALCSSLAVSGCSKEAAPDAAPQGRGPGPSADGLPDIAVSAAPGVAFRYAYTFVLPDAAIGAVQDQHARACEALGPARCRITGMRFNVRPDDRVDARLELKLAPDVARGFGRDAAGVVERARGKLIEAQIEGTDVASKLADSHRRTDENAAQQKQLEEKLAAPAAPAATRNDVRNRLDALRSEEAAERDARAAELQSLAATPMVFDYSGAEGFRLGGNPPAEAAQATWHSTVTMIWAVLLGLGVALPWLVLLIAAMAIWRLRAARRLRTWIAGQAPVEG